MRSTNPAGIALIKKFESLRLKAYKCPAGIWTVGYGHAGDVKEGDVITSHQADAILSVDLDKFERGVEGLLAGITVSDNAFSALVSFAFNVGLEALGRSTLLKRLRAGGPLAAADEFLKWNKAGGKVLSGLVKRRSAERELFLK